MSAPQFPPARRYGRARAARQVLSMDTERARCCCFTGHRPEKLHLPEAELRPALRREIATAIADGYSTFICGMARGVDVYAAEEVLMAAGQHPQVRLICAFPYRESCESFSEPWRSRCRAIAQRADLRVDVCDEYQSGCYHLRNSWMVKRSSRLISVYDGTPGGTRNTMLSALRHGLDVRTIMI